MIRSDEICDLATALAAAQTPAEESLIIPRIARMMRPPIRSNQNDGKTTVDRFFEKIAYGASDCWYWTGAMHKLGYGLMNALGEHKAHRVAWVLFNGPIPSGMAICHKCDIRNCVNPDHLFLGSQLDNIRDMCEKGRQRSAPRYGENNGMSRLTRDQVSSIRAAHASGKSQHALAREYGVAVMTINRAVRGISWSNQ